MAFTSVEIKKSQDAYFAALEGKMGTAMIVDADDLPDSKFWVKDMLNESPVRSHLTKN